MKSTEITQLSDLDLKERVASEREALQELRFNHSIAGLEKPYQLREKRRDIARILTEISARNNAAKAASEEQK
jgi:large subunit ribosomal protein L29